MHRPSQELHHAFFIDEECQLYDGKEATMRLQNKSDVGRIDPQRGIVCVDKARWEEAQRYERRTWMIIGQERSEDRNDYHRKHFASYTPLQGYEFQQGIELGCGPFTNMRLILEHCHIKNIYLLDPLIKEYVKHPFCRYRKNRIGGIFKERATLPVLRHPFTLWRNSLNAWRIGGLWGRSVTLIDSMIEMFSINLHFDLIVMVNVIEHCQDVEAVFSKVLQLLSPDGIFVYGDLMYDIQEVQRLASLSYDAGHPLRVDRVVVEKFLNQHFTPLMWAEYPLARNICGTQLHNTELYFIGKKHPKINDGF